MGNTVTDEIFQFADAHRESGLMPKFTEAQLARLPPVLKEIQEDAGYQRLIEKRDTIEAIRDDASIRPWSEKVMKYDSLDNSKKISKLEVIAVKETMIDLLKKAGVLQIVHKEVTIDIMQAWLEAGKPVFMTSGSQVNLQRMGLDGLAGVDGFVRDYLPGGDETKKTINVMLKKTATKPKNRSEANPQSVAFIGGGPSTMASASDFLKKVEQDDLQVVWISPEEKSPSIPLKIAQLHEQDGKRLKYEWIPGYISEVMFDSEERIDKVRVANLLEKGDEAIGCNLLVHTHKQHISFGNLERSKPIKDKWKHITDILDKILPENGLVRDLAIYLEDDWIALSSRITQEWTVSLENDEAFKKQIGKLVKAGENASLVVSGDNPMIKRIMLLAAMLGYRGHYYQVSVPLRDFRVAELEENLQEEKVKYNWHEVKGRLVKEGTFYQDGKFSLGVIDKNGEKISNIPKVDAIINGAGKTKITPLVQAMEQKQYIGVVEGETIYSKHPSLFGARGFFERELTDLSPSDIQSPSTTLKPQTKGFKMLDPTGWDDIFDDTRRLLVSKPTEMKKHGQ